MTRLALVVDDSQQTADSLSRMLELLDFEAQAAYSPRQALGRLDARKPDVVLLDINMPGIDGFEVLGFLKRDPRLEDVPVVVISSEAQPESVQRALDHGAADFLAKPISLEALENCLARLFGD